jgi:hypothetical protein
VWQRSFEVNELLSQLIEFLKSASPLVWQTLIRQVYSDAIASIVWGVGLVVLCVSLAKLGAYGRKKAEEDGWQSSWDIPAIFSYIGSVISGLVAFGLIVYATQMLVNPEFYAIQYIISRLRGG